MLFCQLQQPIGLVQAEIRSCRVVCQRLGEEQTRALCLQNAFERRKVRPIGQPGDANHARARQLELAKQQVVSRLIHQHRRARWHKVADHQIQRIIGPLGEQQLVLCHRQAQHTQFAHQTVAQRRIAKAVAVTKQRPETGAHHLLVVTVHAHVRQPFDRRKTVPHGSHLRLADELLARQPNRIHRAHQLAVVLIGCLGLAHLRRHVKARTTPWLHHAARHQQIKRRHHRVLGIAVQLRQLPQRRQPVAGLVNAIDDLLADQIGQLFSNGGRASRHVGAKCVREKPAPVHH
ncbi:hypothetical protein D3C72_1354250 [compost metagenome]